MTSRKKRIAGDPPSTVFFGLRSGVELFKEPSAAQAVTRAKEAALLYDRVVFEVGLLDVTVGETGGSSFWLPPNHLTEEIRERARTPIDVGTPFTLSMGVEPSPGVPADPENMFTTISTTVTHAYVAEYHTGILDELEALDLDFVEAVHTPGGDIPVTHPVGDAIKRANWNDWTDKSLLPGLNTFERDLIYKSFNRDALVAASLDAAITVTPLFEPMVAQRGVRIDHAGDEALRILVPNISTLPWEAIAEFRDHPGCQEARAQLREFERLAAENEPQDAATFLLAVAQQVSRAYMQALRDRRTKLGSEFAKEALKTSVSFVPGVGPIVEKSATATQLATQGARERRSWTSAIFKLAETG